MNVLFLCTGNSCRSILGEAIFNHLAPDGWQAMSAGSKPTGQIHPRTLTLLKRQGISTEGYYSKSWNDLPATPDIVLSVCGNAARPAQLISARYYAVIGALKTRLISPAVMLKSKPLS